MAWVYLGMYVVMIVINALVLLRTNPELIAERAQIKEDAKRWDRPLAGIVSFFGPLVTLLVAGLDVRFGWSPRLFCRLSLSRCGYGAGVCLSGWAMVSNKFFSGWCASKRNGGTSLPLRALPVRTPPGYAVDACYNRHALVLWLVVALIPAC